MNVTKTSGVESGKFLLLAIVMMGSLWGLVECSAGVGLRGSCARFYSGSVLTGASMLFFSCAFAFTGRLLLVMALPVIASLFRIYAGLLLGEPVISGAVANPIYAFFMEAVAFVAVVHLIREQHTRSLAGAGLAGMTTAVLAANLFLPVKLFTGIPACVVPGTSFPLSIWGLPAALAVAAVAMPLGFRVGYRLRELADAPERGGQLLPARASLGVTACCLVVVTLMYAW